jgi:[ribosomal protein S5]-alanine N-acetyltransferase
MELRLTRSLLRPWSHSDEPDLVTYANNLNVAKNLRDGFPYPYTEDHAHDWIAMVLSNKSDIQMAIEVEGKAVGGIGLLHKEDVYRINMEIGYWLGEDYWNRGIMTEAVMAMTETGFDRPLVSRIYGAVFGHNKASMRILEKCGYVPEAVNRLSVIKNGIIEDEYIYAIHKR